MANLSPSPDQLTAGQILMCPDIMLSGFAGAENGKIRIGVIVAVCALGPIGLCAIAGAKLMDAATIVAAPICSYRDVWTLFAARHLTT